MELDMKKAGVLVVDVQGDFTEMKHGSLAVQGTGEDYLKRVYDALQLFKNRGLALFATQDYHPENHISFFTNHRGKAVFDTIDANGKIQILWPPHCVRGTDNAELLLDNTLFDVIVKKGCDPDADSYSGFFDDGGTDTGLARILKERGLTTLLVFGLATDYCVKFTALDALKSGFTVFVIKDLCRGVAPGTTRSAIEEMQQAGIKMLEVANLI